MVIKKNKKAHNYTFYYIHLLRTCVVDVYKAERREVSGTIVKIACRDIVADNYFAGY